MNDRLFDGIHWVTTRIDREGRPRFNVVFPALYITMLMAMLMAMAQDCAHGVCTPRTRCSVPLGTVAFLEMVVLLA